MSVAGAGGNCPGLGARKGQSGEVAVGKDGEGRLKTQVCPLFSSFLSVGIQGVHTKVYTKVYMSSFVHSFYWDTEIFKGRDVPEPSLNLVGNLL